MYKKKIFLYDISKCSSLDWRHSLKIMFSSVCQKLLLHQSNSFDQQSHRQTPISNIQSALYFIPLSALSRRKRLTWPKPNRLPSLRLPASQATTERGKWTQTLCAIKLSPHTVSSSKFYIRNIFLGSILMSFFFFLSIFFNTRNTRTGGNTEQHHPLGAQLRTDDRGRWEADNVPGRKPKRYRPVSGNILEDWSCLWVTEVTIIKKKTAL